MRFKKFNDKTGLPEIEGPRFKRKPPLPQVALFWGACFSFGSGDQIREVPYDPYCDYVFMGEEISMAARLYTHGYDLYHPQKMVVFHMWERHRPTFWQQFNNPSNEEHKKRRNMEKMGYERLKYLLDTPDTTTASATTTATATATQKNNQAIVALKASPYGLGSARTLEQYEQTIGISISKQKVFHLAGVLGLPMQSQSPDILHRFGNWKDYKKILNSVSDTFRAHPPP